MSPLPNSKQCPRFCQATQIFALLSFSSSFTADPLWLGAFPRALRILSEVYLGTAFPLLHHGPHSYWLLSYLQAAHVVSAYTRTSVRAVFTVSRVTITLKHCKEVLAWPARRRCGFLISLKCSSYSRRWACSEHEAQNTSSPKWLVLRGLRERRLTKWLSR